MMKSKITEYNTNDLVSIKDMMSITGKDRPAVEGIIRTGHLEAHAELSSKSRGRPQRLFNRSEFDEAVKKAAAAPPRSPRATRGSKVVSATMPIVGIDEASIFSPENFTESTGDAELDDIIAGVG